MANNQKDNNSKKGAQQKDNSKAQNSFDDDIKEEKSLYGSIKGDQNGRLSTGNNDIYDIKVEEVAGVNHFEGS